MNKCLKRNIIVIFVVFLFFPNFICIANEVKKSNNDIVKLYVFNESDIQKILRKAGVNIDRISEITHNDIIRNEEGTEVKIFLRRSNKCIILKHDGEIIIIDIIGNRSWLNKNNEVVAWVEENQLHFKNGNVERMIGPSPSDYDGEFIIKSTINGLKLVTFSRPNYYIADINLLSSRGLKLFKNNNDLFVFGYSTNKSEEYLLKIYKKSSIGYIGVDTCIIPKPQRTSLHYFVEDIKQSGDIVIIKDTYDFPNSSHWYKTNLNTKKIELVGKASFRALYLLENSKWEQWGTFYIP